MSVSHFTHLAPAISHPSDTVLISVPSNDSKPSCSTPSSQLYSHA